MGKERLVSPGGNERNHAESRSCAERQVEIGTKEEGSRLRSKICGRIWTMVQ
jgi:hypothetical protein